MSKKFESPYNPAETEPRIYKKWLDSGYFNPDNLPGDRKETYAIMIAPPNVTGSLHIGHALENTLSDILIRFNRMNGKKTLWVPGTDHAGIATQNVVEKDLKKQGLSRHTLGREKFLEKVWEWKDKYGDIILGQLKRLGCSFDWSRTRFTMDEKYQEAVKTAFAHYQEAGLIYEGERVVNWCVKDQTALSDLELEYEEEKSKLWHIKYPLAGADGKPTKEFIVVATTRPETMLGDTAVAVNPKDERYKNFAGRKIVLPIMNRLIPIVADFAVDLEFGTGAVKVTPAHSIADSEIAERHKLIYEKVIDERGKMINTTAEFDGLKIAEAREKVLANLAVLGLLEKEEDIAHNIAKCYRCGTVVEPMLSKQVFLKMKPLAEKAISAIKSGKVRYYPERWQGIALNWLENVRDWCVSRNIWWGHKVPVENGDFTFDTWFSSALWPFAALGWPEKTSGLKNFYPTATISSARDILHLWISRMIFSGLEFTEETPFQNVLIHATVLNKDGRRMSKSLGTGIDPLVLIDKYGADATRFALAYQSFGGQEIRFDETAVLMGKKFANKVWNIARYAEGYAGGEIFKPLENFAADGAPALDPDSSAFLAKLSETVALVSKNISGFNFGEASHILYDFIWHDFADKFIEQSKTKNDDGTKFTVAKTAVEILKLLHPFMPFVTEEIWAELGQKEMLLISAWPKE